MLNDVKIFAGRHSKELAKNIAKSYGTELGNVVIHHSVMENFNHLLRRQLEEKKFL